MKPGLTEKFKKPGIKNIIENKVRDNS